jgi:hypothetical protein
MLCGHTTELMKVETLIQFSAPEGRKMMVLY